MAIDYRRLVAGLREVPPLATQSPGPPALQSLITTVQESIGARAATFLECRGNVGRIVIATGSMVPTLGQPVGLEHIHMASLLPDDGLRRVCDLPPVLAASPTRYGLVALA